MIGFDIDATKGDIENRVRELVPASFQVVRGNFEKRREGALAVFVSTLRDDEFEAQVILSDDMIRYGKRSGKLDGLIVRAVDQAVSDIGTYRVQSSTPKT